VSGQTPVRSFIPNTHRASSVAAGRDGGSVIYTFSGDSRVYRQTLADSTVALLHDFGAGRIARDAQVVGNRLVAVVDGIPGYRDAPPFLGIQIDYGGILSVVDLTSGTETLVPDRGNLYKHPVLSPSGQELVVEGYPFTTTQRSNPDGTIAIDTVVSKWADLWLLEE
jgi:hypothetical protein